MWFCTNPQSSVANQLPELTSVYYTNKLQFQDLASSFFGLEAEIWMGRVTGQNKVIFV